MRAGARKVGVLVQMVGKDKREKGEKRGFRAKKRTKGKTRRTTRAETKVKRRRVRMKARYICRSDGHPKCC